jgi:hypothetical protein
MFDIPYEVIEYPIENREKRKELFQEKLELDKGWKHVVNVGLFTERKNQKYIFEIARKLENSKIKFHFIGNQADNFKSYWEPLMDNKPENCIVWGEKDNVNEFLEASDLFMFPSKGDRNNKELNPIAIKEAIEYGIPMMMYNLDVYCGKYDKLPQVTFLTGDIDKDVNNMMDVLNVGGIDSLFNLGFNGDNNQITITYNGNQKFDFNVIVIGAGSAGLVTSYIAAAIKAKVALIENHKMGGDCLNTGCVPSKALIRSAKLFSYLKRGTEFGFQVEKAEVNFPQVMQRIQSVIKAVEPHDSVERYTKLGVDCIQGKAKIRTPYEVEVNGNIITAKNIVIRSATHTKYLHLFGP